MKKQPAKIRQRRPRKLKAEKLLELGERAAKYAPSYGRLFDSPEDLKQDYIVRLLEGKHKHSTVGQAVIDIARDLSGRKGLPGYEKRQAVQLAAQTDPAKIRIEENPFESINNRLSLETGMKALSIKQKQVILMYLDGLTFLEIAAILDVSEARANQIWFQAVVLMRDALRVGTFRE